MESFSEIRTQIQALNPVLEDMNCKIEKIKDHLKDFITEDHFRLELSTVVRRNELDYRQEQNL